MIYAIGVVLIVLAYIIGYMAGQHSKPDHRSPLEKLDDLMKRHADLSAPPSPSVVVNVPKDYKTMEPITIDGKPAMVGPRALLWWTVYKACLDNGEDTYPETIAGKAVRDVYGLTYDS